MNNQDKPRSVNDLYEFGPFRLEGRERRLRKGDVPIVLPPKVFETLLLLVENAGHVLTKGELMGALWPGTAVEEGNLTKNIWLIRRALEEREGETRYVETVPKAGYRFVAPLTRGPGLSAAPHASPRPSHEMPSEDAGEASPGNAGEASAKDAGEASIKKTSPRESPGRPRFLTARAGLAAVLVGGLALAALRIRERQTAVPSTPAAAPHPIAARPSVAVLLFRDLSARPDTGWLSTAVSEMMSAELADGDRLRLIPGESIARFGRTGPPPAPGGLSRETLKKLRGALGADFVLSGSYVALGSPAAEEIRLDMTLQDAATGESVAAAIAAGRERDLFALVASAGDRLRARLGLTAAPAAAANFERALLPRNPDAARFYEEGLAKLRAFDALAAQPLLESSIRAEPDFGPAHGALSEVWTALGYGARASAEAGTFFRLAAGAPRAVRDEAEGRLAETQKNWPRAVSLDAAISGAHPDDPEAGLRLARAQIAGGRAGDALATLSAIAALRPPVGDDPRIDLERADAFAALAKWHDELTAARTAAEKALKNGSALLVAEARLREGGAAGRLGDTSAANRAFDAAAGLFRGAGDSNGEAEALIGTANIASDAGNEDDYRNVLRRAQETFARIGNRKGEAHVLSDLADQDWLLGNADAALREAEGALAIDREIDDPGGIVWGLNATGNILADQGQFDRALALQEEAAGICRKTGDEGALSYSLGSTGDTFLAEGRLADARRNYEDALALSTKLGDRGARAVHVNDLANVFAEAGDTANAEASYESALAERRRLGEKEAAAETEMLLAELRNDEGRYAEADRLAADAERTFAALRRSGNRAISLADESRAELGLGRAARARVLSDEARSLLRGNRQNGANLPVLREALRVETEASNPRRAATLLAEFEDCSRKSGWLLFVLESRRARAEIEIRSGKGAEGLQRIRTLAEEARADGIGRVETEARNLLARPPASASSPK